MAVIEAYRSIRGLFIFYLWMLECVGKVMVEAEGVLVISMHACRMSKSNFGMSAANVRGEKSLLEKTLSGVM